MFTTTDLDQMVFHADFEGFGYIGARINFVQGIVEGEIAPELAGLLAAADAKVLRQVNTYGIEEDEFFDWANSRNGRYYGDAMFGGGEAHATQYLPHTI